MSGGSVRIHPAALQEADAATAWYAERSERAAEMFLDELDRIIEQVNRNPDQYPAHEFGTRRAVLRRFPFLLIFRQGEAGVEVIGVAHARRRPGYWRERLG